MTQPVISVIITNYNYSRYLSKCVASCVEQRGDIDFEVIVVDDGSTDDSIEVVRPFLGDRVRLIQRSNGGIEAAANAGIAESRSDLVVRVDADDYLLPDFLQVAVTAIHRSDDAFVYPDYIVVDGDGAPLYEEGLPEFSPQEIQARGDFLATGTVYRRRILQELGGYEESTRNCGLENYALVLKLLRMGHTGYHIAQTLFAYRRHGGNISAQRKEAIVSYGKRLFVTLGFGAYRTNAYHPYRLEIDHE